MQEQGEIIPLIPPLPWLCGAQGCGFALGLTEDRLKVSAPVKLPEQTSTTLWLALPDTATISLNGQFLTTPDNQTFFVAGDAQSRATLADLKMRSRKDRHIDLCGSTDVEAADRFTGFGEVSLIPVALPELNYREIDTSCAFLGRTFALPLMIAGMTGGTPRGTEINRRLARAAVKFAIPMGVGSQRVALDNTALREAFELKREFPGLFLIGNIGCAQILAGDGLAKCRAAVEMIGADALAIHVNVLQECIQTEGDRNFGGLLSALESIQARLPVPLIVKEVGCGIDPHSATMLYRSGIRTIDIGGKGGTSWAFIEGQRSNAPAAQMLATSFRDFGIPTAHSLKLVADALPDLSLIATGGIRDGLTIAKAVGLGAKVAGIGLPLFRAALASEDEPLDLLQAYAHGLRTAMLATASRTLSDLKGCICLGRHPLQHPFQTSLEGRKPTP